MKEPTKEQFLKDVEKHEMTILRNDGLYRHLRFKNPQRSAMWFDIVTWPGVLAIRGDMGDAMLSRIEDMFEFFGGDIDRINPGYWKEKVIAQSVYGKGVEKFDVDAFREAVKRDVAEQLELDSYVESQIEEETLEELKSLFNAEDEYECVDAMRSFRSQTISFGDFDWDSATTFTYHYIWRCYAITWGIGKFWEATKAAECASGVEK